MLFFRKRQHKSLQVEYQELEELKQNVKRTKESLLLFNSKYEELLKEINNFELTYNKRLGKLVKRILNLRMQKAKKLFESDPIHASMFEETKRDFEEFNQKEDDLTKIEKNALSKDEENLLKKTYRKAAMLCHPDIVTKNEIEVSNKIFIELNEAYGRNDLQKVLEISANLENATKIKSDEADNSDLAYLKKQLDLLQRKLEELKIRITTIEEGATYQIIKTTSDFTAYFDDLEIELRSQIADLENNI